MLCSDQGSAAPVMAAVAAAAARAPAASARGGGTGVDDAGAMNLQGVTSRRRTRGEPDRTEGVEGTREQAWGLLPVPFTRRPVDYRRKGARKQTRGVALQQGARVFDGDAACALYLATRRPLG